MCACASPSPNLETIREYLRWKPNWDLLLDLAEEHCVQGLLMRRMEQAEFAWVPASAREKLQSRMRAQSLFTLSMTAELFRVLEEFSLAKIEAILVKGPITSLLAYGDPGLRNYVDLDLLVRNKHIELATQTLLAMGLEADVPESLVRAGKIPGEYLFNRPGARHVIELHTERTFRYYPKRMPIERLFARSRRLLLDGQEVPALSLEDEFVLDCVHGAKHFWERLMWVSDVAAMIGNHPEIDWQKAQELAAEAGAKRMLSVVVLLGSLLFQTKLPAAVADEIAGDHNCEELCRQVQEWLPHAGYAPPPLRRRAMFRADIAGGGLDGLIYLVRLSLSPTEEDWKEGAEKHRSWIWDALHRPFRLMRKYGQHQ